MSERTIWKFALDPVVPRVEMPAGARLISVHEQGRLSSVQICVWAEVDPTAEKVQRALYAVGTGHIVPPETVYVGTAHLLDVFDQPLVIHVYDGGEL